MLLVLLIMLLAFVLNIWLPWWTIALPGLLFGYVLKPAPGKAFLAGFVALFVLWGSQTLYIHIANNGFLSSRIAEMLGGIPPFLLILISAIIGGLVSGLAALTGSLVRVAVDGFSPSKSVAKQ